MGVGEAGLRDVPDVDVGHRLRNNVGTCRDLGMCGIGTQGHDNQKASDFWTE